MRDIIIIRDTSTLCHFLVKRGEKQVCLIPVSQIRAPETILEMGSALIGVVTAAIEVVKLKSHTYPLTCVNGKKGVEIILTVGSVARTI